MAGLLPPKFGTSLLGLFPSKGAKLVSLEELISQNIVPDEISWQPSACIELSNGTIVLVHALADREIPPYVQSAAALLTNRPNIKILILSRTLLIEGEAGKSMVPAQYAASGVADQCIESGFGLAFENKNDCVLVFPFKYSPPARCATEEEEVGHIPSWLRAELVKSKSFSKHLERALLAFQKKYTKASSGKKINYQKECDLLLDFAKKVAKGNPRLHFPFGQLDLLREWELRRANPRARDHFFHTFNNFFLGLYVLSHIAKDGVEASEVDGFIAKKGRSGKLATWEALWCLTCLFHDPGYVAEKYWGTFRFSFGLTEDEALDEDQIPESAKKHIKNAWDTEFAQARSDLVSLYERTQKWKPPSRKKAKSSFDSAMEEAYFDGRTSSHSLVSGLKLIKYCSPTKIPSSHNADEAVTASAVAALSMMFHDPRCRELLMESGIAPISFEKLPYASLLMFVDSIQDDRRSIEHCKFRVHGILSKLSVDAEAKRVLAEVCLPEVDNVRGWPGRIAEYEGIMNWINAKSGWQFIIDYRTKAHL
jgi:hypothetical protein